MTVTTRLRADAALYEPGVCGYALHGQPTADVAARRALAPWYRDKHAVSFADMLVALGLLPRHEPRKSRRSATVTNAADRC